MKTCQSCLLWEPNQKTVEQTEDGKYQCLNPEVAIRTPIEFGCTLHIGPDSTEANVPNHCRNGTMTDPNPNPVDGPTQVFIVTYWKDLPWLKYALRSIQKYLRGFQGVTVATPNPVKINGQVHFIPAAFFDEMSALGPNKIRVHYYDEPHGKGMIDHMRRMAEADLIVPPGTKYVLHSDADCIFKMPTTPEHYFWNDKPYYLIRSWGSLGVLDSRHPINKVMSDCAQWKPATDAQLGWDTEWYTMCMNTAVLPIDFYKPYRDHVAQTQKQPFEHYMLSGENAFPQSRMDWTAMGAFAHKFLHDRFTWFDVENAPYPVDRKRAFWSHGGITPEIRTEIETMLG